MDLMVHDIASETTYCLNVQYLVQVRFYLDVGFFVSRCTYIERYKDKFGLMLIGSDLVLMRLEGNSQWAIDWWGEGGILHPTRYVVQILAIVVLVLPSLLRDVNR